MNARFQKKNKYVLFSALFCMMLASCALPPIERTPSATTQSQPIVVALLEHAGKATQSGDLEQASAVLERALRIDPSDAIAWHRLAQVRFYQQRFVQAISLAAKSNSLAGNDQRLRQANDRLIKVAGERRSST